MRHKEIPVCMNCGSANVFRDAYATWDAAAQDWTLHSVYDNATCENCGDSDARIEMRVYVERGPERRVNRRTTSDRRDAK